jgi:V/A-type H+/Na+-transporting ATPase subunit K
MKSIKRFSGIILNSGLVFFALSMFDIVRAEDASIDLMSKKWAFLAAALSTAISAVAAGIAVAYVGSSAVGAMSEKPEIGGRALIYVGLAEGIAIYGLIISIMILGKV